ncbi:rhodanese-like domain-containing protein [Costertonia aggregata]|uniref:Rhodanese-like domain-containing protein n=1 Tax=Costertonia aggregata TaxID=343403 RepID=A0A7H9ARC1_9FLAO|nr:rhodanese-like domain-containing protein [Costertonia aggregata]QLG45785.1 rhodanese-like domain-containing protein [Costertonia aggregata]
MKLLPALFLLLFYVSSFSQSKLHKTLKKFNTESVTYITVEELSKKDDVVLLDTRKKEEFNVSHIKNSIWVGHKAFQMDSVYHKIPNKDQEIIVYCSIGVRSEDIGEELIKFGYTNVKNLYGGIFEWKNQDQPVYNLDEKKTEKVHAFSKHWGKLLTKGKKVYR